MYGSQTVHAVLSELMISLSPWQPVSVPVCLTHLVLLAFGTLPLQHVKQVPSCWTISSGSVQEFKHLMLSADAFKLLGHLMHSVLSKLKTENSSQPGAPLMLIAGLGLTIQFLLCGSGMVPGGHHSHCGQSKSSLKI